jgi:hypothetical protein
VPEGGDQKCADQDEGHRHDGEDGATASTENGVVHVV